jgi:hypothetical protein
LFHRSIQNALRSGIVIDPLVAIIDIKIHEMFSIIVRFGEFVGQFEIETLL